VQAASPLEPKQRVCQSKLRHVCTGHWVSYESLSEPWCMCMSLTGRRAIARTNPCTVLLGLYSGRGMHRSSDTHQAWSDMINLDCFKVKAIIADYDMTIISLDNFHSMLSCLPAPPDVLSTSCGRRADSSGTGTLHRSCRFKEWASRCLGLGS
jgi:hypothetical protein